MSTIPEVFVCRFSPCVTDHLFSLTPFRTTQTYDPDQFHPFQQLFQFFHTLYFIHCRLKLCRMWIPCRIPRHMLFSHLTHRGARSYTSSADRHGVESSPFTSESSGFFGTVPCSRYSAVCAKIHGFPALKTTDHHTITSGFFEVLLLSVVNPHLHFRSPEWTQLFFTFRMISSLLFRNKTAVVSVREPQRVRTTVLDDLCDLHRIHMIIVKSFRIFTVNGFLIAFAIAVTISRTSFRFFHQCGSLTIINHFRHRASHVDIQNIKRLSSICFAISP